jgi:hypothetical protein
MNITINGKAHDLGLQPGTSFPEVMSAVSRLNVVPGSGITRVKLNGEDITGRDWSHLSAMDIATIEQLEVSTGDIAVLAGDLLDSLEDFTGRLIGELGRTVECFRVGDEAKAIQQYARILDGIHILQHTTEMTERNLGIDSATLVYNGRPTNEYATRLRPVIDDMLSAQQKGDLVLLADLIEYELIPQFEDHQQVLRLWRNSHETRK